MVLTGQDSVAQGSIVSDDLYIGAGPGNFQPWKGLIDELRISNTARYTSNFSYLRHLSSGTAIQSYCWHFDENGDDPRNTGKAIDDSGNGNHGQSPAPNM